MKISVKQVLSEALFFLIKNYKRFIGVCILYFIYSIISIIINELTNTKNTDSLFYVAISFIYAFFALMSIILLPKITMLLMVFINSLMDCDNISIKNAFAQTRGKYWIFFSRVLLLIMLSIPGIIIFFVIKTPISTILGSLYFACIMCFFYLVPSMIALEPKTNRYIRKSLALLKNNYFAAFLLTLIISTFPSMIINIGKNLFHDNYQLIILNIIYAILYTVVIILSFVTNVIVYRQLIKNASTQWRK